MMRTLTYGGIVAGGAYILFPVVVIIGLLWFVDTLRTHAEQRDAEQPDTMADWRPDIPECDEPLWERIKDRCTQEDSDARP